MDGLVFSAPLTFPFFLNRMFKCSSGFRLYVSFMSRVIEYFAWDIYLLCLMVVCSTYCIVVSLLFSPSLDKPCICKYVLGSLASISSYALCGWESNVISYMIIFN